MMKTRRSLAAVALLFLSASAGAMSICRWVNESGRTQIAEVVPEKYRKVAICTDSEQYELSPEQRRAAEQRVAEDKARARQAEAKAPAVRASNAAREARAASQAGAKRPAEVVSDATDCPTWWRIYDESVEGFDKCNVVVSPEPKCVFQPIVDGISG